MALEDDDFMAALMLKSELSLAVKNRDWEKVVETFKEYPETRAMEVNKNSDTALHAAITNGAPESKVGEMVDVMSKDSTLAVNNCIGNTPLHCAAMRGSLYICQCIVRSERSLVEKQNKARETPLFLAALNGQKDIFFYLHNICKDIHLVRRFNGDTILHCTIQRMYFDLSYQIIHLYEDIASFFNELGETPLHILASTPHAFKSGTRLEWWDELCYNFIQVKKLKFEPPEAYEVVDVVQHSDTDNKIHAPVESHESILGSIRRKKEKHVWGGQIMEELVKRSIKLLDPQGHPRWTPPLLIAVEYGLIELVIRILDEKPEAINDANEFNRNIVLVAVKERQSIVLREVMRHPSWNHVLKYAVDIDGNNALHLAAELSFRTTWELRGSPMHMQWEIKWFEWVRKMLPPQFCYAKDKNNNTPGLTFAAHKHLFDKEKGTQWLKNSSTSYIVASTIITSVTYGASYQFLADSDESTGNPKLVGDLGFDTFALANFFAFTFSITALAAFLAVYRSASQAQEQRNQHRRNTIPLMLLSGLGSLFLSILATLVAFYAAHSHQVIRRNLHIVSPLYALTLLSTLIFIATQIPLFWDILRDSLHPLPHPACLAEDRHDEPPQEHI